MSTYYVSTGGSDSNPGTLASPFLTVNKGVSVLTPGDTLAIRTGTYAESIVQPSITGTDWTTGLIRIQNYQAEVVWLKPPDASCNWVLDLQSGQQYLEFSGINLDTTNATSGNAMGGLAVSGADNSHHIRYINGEIIGNRIAGDLASSRVGIVLNGQTGFNEIGPGVSIHGSAGPNSYYGMYLHSQDNTVDGVEIYDMGLAGIQVYNSGGWAPDRNTIKNCVIHDIIEAFDTRRVGLLFMGDSTLVENNIIYNINEDSTGVDTIAIVLYGATNSRVLNNTITDNHSTAFNVSGASNLIANNISFGNDNNAIVGTGSTSVTNLIGTDPVFVNPGAFDYDLQAASPAINVGTTYSDVPYDIIGTPRPQGAAYDIGAYEYIQSILVPQDLIYVATTGSDSTGNGTITKPLGTIRNGVAQLTAGKTLYIRGGTYTGATNTINSNLGTIDSGTDFTTGAITIAAYPSESVTIQPPDGSTGIEFGGGQHHLIVQDLVIDMINNTTIGSGPDGVFLNAASHHNRFSRVTVKNNSSSGFRTSKGGGSPDHNEFLSCLALDNGRLAETNSGYGFYIFSDDTTVQDCIISGNNGYGIVVGGDPDPQYVSDGNVITGNRIAGNFVHGTDTGGGLTSYGISLTYTSNTVVSNNVVLDNQGGIIVGAGSDGDEVLNNTFTANLRDGGGGLQYPVLLDGYTSAPTLDSNIVFNNGNNDGDPGGGIQDNGGTGSPTIDHNTTDDPIFVNPPSDLNLDPGSPAIGTGAPVPVVPVDYYGVEQPTPSDGGALVYTATPVTTTTTIGTVTPTSPAVTQTYTVAVAVAPTVGSSTPSGSVTLNDGVGNVVTVPVAGGTALVPMPAPSTAQTVTLEATFSGIPAPFAPSTDTASVTITSSSGPLPSPPTNITAATAYDIGTLDGYTAFTSTQDAFNGVDVDELWYSYLPVAGDDMLEVYGYGDDTIFWRVHTTVWSGPVASLTQLANSGESVSRPIQQDIVTEVVPGESVFFQFKREFNAIALDPSILTLRIARGQKELNAPGDLFINDSAPGYQGITMSPTTAIPKRYALNYPAGEGQQVLTNGVVGVIDAFTLDGVVLYDVSTTGVTVRATPTMPDAHYTTALGSNQIDTFWALNAFGVGNNHAVSIDQNGVVGTPLDLGFNSISDIQPQADNTVLYAIRGTEIKAITNPGGVGSVFKTVDATFSFANNLLMMTDDTLLVGYEKAATTSYIKRFDLAGTLLTTITLTGVVQALERIFADDEDPTYFWIWWQTATENRFQKIKVSDGSVVVDLTRMKFNSGISQTTDLTGSTIYSGADFSCVPIMLRTVQETPDTGTPPIMRRQRRFLLPSSPDNHFMQIPTLELLMRTGIGLTAGPEDDPVQGEDPQVMLRYSTDGGKSWSNERWRSAGPLGQYLGRVRWLQATGRYRNALVEVTLTDPVDWQLLSMMGEPKEGKQ